MCADNNMSNTTFTTLSGQTSTLAGMVALSLLGIPPSLLTIVLILRAKRRKSTTTYFLLNLAIADFVNLLSSLLLAIVEFLSIQDEETLWTITGAPQAVVNVTLAVIALERYNGLVKTMAVNMGKRKVKIILGVTWSACIVFYMSGFAYKMTNNGATKAIFYIICVGISYVLPLVVVGYCYGKILKVAYHEGGTIWVQNAANVTTPEEIKRFIRIMVVVTVVFMACNLPAAVVKMRLTAAPDVSVSRGLWNTLKLLGCVSSTVNPYIYGLHSKRYRKQVKGLLCCENSQTS